MQILGSMAVKNWLPWNVKVGKHVIQVLKIFSEDFQEKSPSLGALPLIVMKFYIFKVVAGLKRSPRSE